MKTFTLLRKDFSRVAMWYQFFPTTYVTLGDKVLAEKCYYSQWFLNQKRGEDGSLIRLSHKDAKKVRDWFDFIPEAVADESDGEFAEKLDEFLASYA